MKYIFLILVLTLDDQSGMQYNLHRNELLHFRNSENLCFPEVVEEHRLNNEQKPKTGKFHGQNAEGQEMKAALPYLLQTRVVAEYKYLAVRGSVKKNVFQNKVLVREIRIHQRLIQLHLKIPALLFVFVFCFLPFRKFSFKVLLLCCFIMVVFKNLAHVTYFYTSEY